MKFGRFIKFRFRGIIAAAICIAVFVLFLSLNGMELRELAYPVLLCTVFCLCILAADYLKVSSKCRELRKAERGHPETAGEFPAVSEVYEEEYQRIIQLLADDRMQTVLELNAGYNDMVDYYSTWAHQIKTPIASMQLKLQNEDSEFSRQIRQDLNEIERYVDMVMTYLRLDSKSSDLLIRELEIDSVIRPVIRGFSSDFIAKGLKLDYKPVKIKAVTDEKWLGFVIEQLISNAIKYTAEGAVSVRSDNDSLYIEDTGIGIAPEDLPRIFEKGYTGFNGRNGKKASGIGLYLCKRICDRLGHGISVSSVPGESTCVRIDFKTFPLEIE